MAIPRMSSPLLAPALAIGLAIAPRWALALGDPPKAEPAVRASAEAVAAAAEESKKEHWYVVEVAGQRSGWMRLSTTTSPIAITSDHEMSLSIMREKTPITVRMHSIFVETPEGKPVSMKQVSALGSAPVTQLYEFREKDVKVTTTANGTPQTSVQPLPEGQWLTPAQVERRITERLKAGDHFIITPSLSPAHGLTITSETRFNKGKESLKHGGRKIQVTRCDVKNSAAPDVPVVELLGADGTLYRQETSMGTLPIVMKLATREEALEKAGSPEIMVGTFIIPQPPIRQSRRLTSASYVLSVPDGRLPEIASAGAQAVTRLDERSARVIVNRAGVPEAPGEDVANKMYQTATTAADTRDPEVLKLHAKATADLAKDLGKPERAEALRRFVGTFIRNKNLAVGFATASETARSGEGDCTEHGVLLAALLRIEGIPSRVVSGLIHVERLAGGKGAFGYHLWTQALLEVDGAMRWVDLDATLGDSPFDAAHIALSSSDLSDGDTMTAMVSVAPLMGRLSIKVDGTEPPQPLVPDRGAGAKDDRHD